MIASLVHALVRNTTKVSLPWDDASAFCHEGIDGDVADRSYNALGRVLKMFALRRKAFVVGCGDLRGRGTQMGS